MHIRPKTTTNNDTIIDLELHYKHHMYYNMKTYIWFMYDTCLYLLGLHYVGRMSKYAFLFNLVSTGKKVKWAQMGNEENGFCYDEVR